MTQRLHAALRRLAAVTVPVALAASTVIPAHAETVTRWDPQPKCSQRPALDVKRATFNYAANKFVWRVKMGALSKRHTQVIARYTVGTLTADDFGVIISTRYDATGRRLTVARWSDYRTGDYDNRFRNGVSATWDFKRSVVTFTLTDHLQGQRARAHAYSVEKGQLHGPPCGDYVGSGLISRG